MNGGTNVLMHENSGRDLGLHRRQLICRPAAVSLERLEYLSSTCDRGADSVSMARSEDRATCVVPSIFLMTGLVQMT